MSDRLLVECRPEAHGPRRHAFSELDPGNIHPWDMGGGMGQYASIIQAST